MEKASVTRPQMAVMPINTRVCSDNPSASFIYSFTGTALMAASPFPSQHAAQTGVVGAAFDPHYGPHYGPQDTLLAYYEPREILLQRVKFQQLTLVMCGESPRGKCVSGILRNPAANFCRETLSVVTFVT
jgi:hypothetical protein